LGQAAAGSAAGALPMSSGAAVLAHYGNGTTAFSTGIVAAAKPSGGLIVVASPASPTGPAQTSDIIQTGGAASLRSVGAGVVALLAAALLL